MRLFVGIAQASETAVELQRVRDRLEPKGGDLRWSSPETWHVTLQFLGSASDQQAACVQKGLGGIEAARVTVRMAGLGFFERAGVFWAGVGLSAELLELQQKVVAATRRCGFLPEDRAWNPHITLARAKGRSGVRALAALQAAVERGRIHLNAEFTAGEFLLYESFPGPGGSRYEVRARFPLR